MTANPREQFAAYPNSGTATADSLALYEAVGALLYQQRADAELTRDRDAFTAAIGHTVGAFSVAYLLVAFQDAAPEAADEAARGLTRMREYGDLNPWLSDLLAGDGIDPEAVADLGRRLAEKRGAA